MTLNPAFQQKFLEYLDMDEDERRRQMLIVGCSGHRLALARRAPATSAFVQTIFTPDSFHSGGRIRCLTISKEVVTDTLRRVDTLFSSEAPDV